MHNLSGSRFISFLLLQCLYPFTDIFPQTWGSCQQSLLTIGPVFLSYLWPSWGQKLIWSAPNVITWTLLTYLSHSVSFCLPLHLSGWMAIPYWSVLFLSCGCETVPTLWMSDDSPPLGNAGYVDCLWVFLDVTVDVINRKQQRVTSLRGDLTLIIMFFFLSFTWQRQLFLFLLSEARC